MTAGYLLFLSGLILIGFRLNQPKPKSENDLKFITGQINYINLVRKSRGYRNFKFGIVGYPNAFKIKADFVKYFEETAFESLSKNDSITVAISNEDSSKLISGTDYLFVYSIKNKTTTFLSSTDTIAFQNSNKKYYYFSGLILLGIISIFQGYKLKKKQL